MAWFQNLAGRAEDLLNKIDQNAATVLNDTNGSNKMENELKLPTTLDHNEISRPSSTENGNVNLNMSNHSPEKIRNDTLTLELHEENPPLTQKIETPNSIVVIDEHILEELSKSETLSSKSSSLQNSLIVCDEVQNERLAKLESENHDLNRQLLNLQHQYAELRNENGNLQSQLESSVHLVATAQSEMEQYKARAQRILQEKEQLITLKKENSSTEGADNIWINYNTELKKELEFQQKKNAELTDTVAQLTQDAAYLQQQIVLLQNTSQKSSQSLEESLLKEKKMRIMAEEDCRLKNREMQSKLQEIAEKTQLIALQNEEISLLKENLMQKTVAGANEDYETQIKNLIDTLMFKQNTLETVTTERNALRIQLEKLENEYHQNLAQLQKAQVRVINVNDTNDVKSQVPQFMRLSPFDAGVTKRVKHAYSTVDAISIRTGIFLRRYPVARVFVFCYMVLLHLWAFIILFLYVPSSR